jgi:hypothetical protein
LNIRKLGCEAYGIYANNESLQKMWAREHKLKDYQWQLAQMCGPAREHRILIFLGMT